MFCNTRNLKRKFLEHLELDPQKYLNQNHMLPLVEWMNEWGIYIALYCVWLYTQSALQSCGGSLLNTECSVFAGIVLHYKNNRTLIENLEFVPSKNMFTLYCTMLHSTILYHTVVYSILLYCTINCKCTNCPETQIWVLWEFGWPCRGGWNISDRSSSPRIEDSGALEVDIRSITGHEPHCRWLAQIHTMCWHHSVKRWNLIQATLHAGNHSNAVLQGNTYI